MLLRTHRAILAEYSLDLVDRLLGLTGDPDLDIYTEAYAAWWLWARLAGWDKEVAAVATRCCLYKPVKSKVEDVEPFAEVAIVKITAVNAADNTKILTDFRGEVRLEEISVPKIYAQNRDLDPNHEHGLPPAIEITEDGQKVLNARSLAEPNPAPLIQRVKPTPALVRVQGFSMPGGQPLSIPQ